MLDKGTSATAAARSFRAKTGNTHYEQMCSGLPPAADFVGMSAQCQEQTVTSRSRQYQVLTQQTRQVGAGFSVWSAQAREAAPSDLARATWARGVPSLVWQQAR
jgi:hypothetical protein